MKNYCPHCGEPLKENADFCLSCGKLTKEHPKHHGTRYLTMSKTMIAIISFFAILFVVNVVTSMFSSMFYRTTVGLGMFIPGSITIILALLIGVVAIIENNNKQLSKETFIIAVVISGFYIFQTASSLISYYSFWVNFR